jgi:hypothetical protein
VSPIETMTPVLAWCERCGGGFPLFAIVEQGTGACPHCRQPLTSDPTGTLVEWAAVADAAYGRLVTAVQQLEQLPGHLRINTHQLLGSLTEEMTQLQTPSLTGAPESAQPALASGVRITSGMSRRERRW